MSNCTASASACPSTRRTPFPAQRHFPATGARARSTPRKHACRVSPRPSPHQRHRKPQFADDLALHEPPGSADSSSGCPHGRHPPPNGILKSRSKLFRTPSNIRAERQPPLLGDQQAPGALAVAGQLMRPSSPELSPTRLPAPCPGGGDAPSRKSKRMNWRADAITGLQWRTHTAAQPRRSHQPAS